MKLYHSPTSPFVRKVLVCAHERGLADRIEIVPTIVAPHVPNADYARLAPLAKVPALECDDGTLLYDSSVICEFLDQIGELAGGPRLFPAAGAARWRALTLHALGDGILDAALLARYELAARPQALRWQDWLDGQFRKIDQGLDRLEGAPRALDGDLDIGQVAIGCALGYLDLRFADRDWRAGRPRVAAWFATTAQRPSFRSTEPTA